MPYWLGYSIYSSQNPSTSVSSSLAAKEKGPPSDLESKNGVPPLSQTYILYDYIYDGTNKTKQREIARCLSKGAHFMVRTHAEE